MNKEDKIMELKRCSRNLWQLTSMGCKIDFLNRIPCSVFKILLYRGLIMKK